MTSDLAYQMYMQGMSHKDIGDSLGFDEVSSRHIVRNYALRFNLPFPREGLNLSLCYDLYVNGMSTRNIARYFGVTESAIRSRLERFCTEHRIELPTKKNRAKVAYELKEKYGFSYEKIAQMVGYENRSNCFRAIKEYKNKC